MKRASYNLIRDGAEATEIKSILRRRYGISNARWAQYAIIEAKGIVRSQEERLAYRIEMVEQKMVNLRQKSRRLRNPMKIRGCNLKLARLSWDLAELKKEQADGSMPRVVFGTKRLLHQLSIANQTGRRRELSAEWKRRRASGFFSVGAVNDKGNANTKLVYQDDLDAFSLEIRNWSFGDFVLPLEVPEHSKHLLRELATMASSFNKRKPRDAANRCIPYTIRVIRSRVGYQVMVSFELEEPRLEWNGRVAGIDINPEGIGCSVVSVDGNLLATRFFGDRRLVTAKGSKRKWILENLVKVILRWCRDTYGCNALALEEFRFKGVFDSSRRNNFVLSNFMKGKMEERIRLSGIKMGMLSVGVPAAYTSMVAETKCGGNFGGFNRHQLAAFVIARRALGFGEAPTSSIIPTAPRDRRMWNYCLKYYGHQSLIQTLFRREPLERKSVGNVNGSGLRTKLLTAPPANTPGKGLSQDPSVRGGFDASPREFSRRAGRVHPNGQASRGDGARGHRVNPPLPVKEVSGTTATDYTAVSKLSTNQKTP